MRTKTKAQRLQRSGHELRRVLFAGFLGLLKVAVWLPLVWVRVVFLVPHAGHVGRDHGAFGDEGVVGEGDVFEGVAMGEDCLYRVSRCVALSFTLMIRDGRTHGFQEVSCAVFLSSCCLRVSCRREIAFPISHHQVLP